MPQLDLITFLLHFKFLFFVFFLVYFNFELFILPSIFVKHKYEFVLFKHAAYLHILRNLHFLKYYMQSIKDEFGSVISYLYFKIFTCLMNLFNTVFVLNYGKIYSFTLFYTFFISNVFFFNEVNILRLRIYNYLRVLL